VSRVPQGRAACAFVVKGESQAMLPAAARGAELNFYCLSLCRLCRRDVFSRGMPFQRALPE
jgi:hypothetical protein